MSDQKHPIVQVTKFAPYPCERMMVVTYDGSKFKVEIKTSAGRDEHFGFFKGDRIGARHFTDRIDYEMFLKSMNELHSAMLDLKLAAQN